MLADTHSFPFSETPGKELGRGFVYIVKELGPDWVIKEFNPLKPDGTPKKAEEIKLSQNPQHIKDLQDSQSILSQSFIYGKKLIPTYWILVRNESGKEKKYITIQKRFKGQTLSNLQDPDKFAEFFSKNNELRMQVLELIWGAKRALIETGTYDDFHLGNIALIEEEGSDPNLNIFDIPNVVRLQKILYGKPPASTETKAFVLNVMEQRAIKLREYERRLKPSEQEKQDLDRKFGINLERYFAIVGNLEKMREEVKVLKDSSN